MGRLVSFLADSSYKLQLVKIFLEYVGKAVLYVQENDTAVPITKLSSLFIEMINKAVL